MRASVKAILIGAVIGGAVSTRVWHFEQQLIADGAHPAGAGFSVAHLLFFWSLPWSLVVAIGGAAVSELSGGDTPALNRLVFYAMPVVAGAAWGAALSIFVRHFRRQRMLPGLLVLFLVGCRQNAVETPARILNACPDSVSACVPMLLDAPTLDSVRVAESPPVDSIGSSDMTLRVPGRLAGGAPSTHELVVRVFRDGMECSAFGQGNVAVVGFSERYEPVILTDRGPLMVEGTAITAGCRDCLKARGDTTSYATPAWDLFLTGNNPSQFFFLTSGDPVLRAGDKCVTLRGMFRSMSMGECDAQIARDREAEVRSLGCT